MTGWLAAHPWIPIGLGVFSVVCVVGAALALPPIVARLPDDWFVRERQRRRRHPILSTALAIARNLVGWLLVIAGIALLFLPGQGLLTIVVGLGFVDFPGKRRVEAAVLRRVEGPLNWLRRRRGRPPLRFPGDAARPDAAAPDRSERSDRPSAD